MKLLVAWIRQDKQPSSIRGCFAGKVVSDGLKDRPTKCMWTPPRLKLAFICLALIFSGLPFG